MTNLTNFDFEEHLVRVVMRDGDPWFVGKDVCAVLDLRNPHQAMAGLDDDERDTLHIKEGNAGNPERVIISEPGVYRLVFRSRKPEAERFKRWLAHEVLPQIRRTGIYAPPEPTGAALREAVTVAIDRDAPMGSKAEILRVCRALFGKEAARALWSELGLPEVEPDPMTGTGEAVAVMRRILDHVPEGGDGRTVRMLTLDAMEGDETARLALIGFGIRPSEDTDGFWITNSARPLRALFAMTGWADGSWRLALRRLRGAQTGPRASFAGHQSRTTWFPTTVLDEWSGTRA